MLYRAYFFSQSVRYWYGIYDKLVPFFTCCEETRIISSQCERATCIKGIFGPPMRPIYIKKIFSPIDMFLLIY